MRGPKPAPWQTPSPFISTEQVIDDFDDADDLDDAPGARVFDAARAYFGDAVNGVPLQRTRGDVMFESILRAKGSPTPGAVLARCDSDEVALYLEDPTYAKRLMTLLLDLPSAGSAMYGGRASYTFRRTSSWLVASGMVGGARRPAIGFECGLARLDDAIAFVMLPARRDVLRVLMISPHEHAQAPLVAVNDQLVE